MNVINRITLKGLKKNKVRTIVTIIGVILSAAMITAVTTLISSFQSYMVNFTIFEEGDWHTCFYNCDKKDIANLANEDELDNISVIKSGGYALLEGSKNEHKPYLHILEFDESAMDMMPLRLINGRMPQNENEVLVSYHTFTNGGVKFKIGDILKLDIGYRILEDGTILDQNVGYKHTDSGLTEKLVTEKTEEFIVTGICERLPFSQEGYSAPGYTLITTLNKDLLINSDKVDIFFSAKNPREIYDITERLIEKVSTEAYGYNSPLLRLYGISMNDNYLGVLYSLAAILISLIMIGSISLIYNAFSISVSERKKQFGLLSGAGATSRQLKRSVFFEALVISGIGIPLGILSGILGIGVTLYLLKDSFTFFNFTGFALVPTMKISTASIVVAAITTLVTILISAFVPAKRAAKASAIDSIRQSTDIKLTSKKVKTSRITRKLFGMPGDLAMKNFKRNKRRYRSTVISLFISIVLFISTSAFCMYLVGGTTSVYEVEKFDLYYSTNERILSEPTLEAINTILRVEEITEGQLVKQTFVTAELSKDILIDTGSDEEDASVVLAIYSIDHETFSKYVKSLGLDETEFSNPDMLTGIMIDRQHYYDYEVERFIDTNMLKEKKPMTFSIEFTIGDGNAFQTDIYVAAFAHVAPFAIRDYSSGNYLTILIDEDMIGDKFADVESQWSKPTLYMKANDPRKAESRVKDILIDAGLSTSGLYNAAANMQQTKNIITVMQVFSYGFITLISLIAIANVFNTISTNINLRRREFAMLKSVGMTSSGFNKMLNYECVFYGAKALFYGLPVAILVTWLIFKSVQRGLDTSFHLPLNSILVSILSVFIVVFVTMMYSMRKIRKENILDALRNENI